mmetsp:Transcript_66796/g.145692  ORF Transcript_66796/g.145692 Transcript_66796/m.145692 type:complete len:123 (-) Transcript_66796:54-422(-)
MPSLHGFVALLLSFAVVAAAGDLSALHSEASCSDGAVSSARSSSGAGRAQKDHLLMQLASAVKRSAGEASPKVDHDDARSERASFDSKLGGSRPMQRAEASTDDANEGGDVPEAKEADLDEA